ncbi:MAG: IS66 family transposase, partial [Ardenticatenaceae bacterium]
WQHLRETLNRFFVVSEENIRPRDDALVKQLLNQVQVLLEKLNNSDQLTPQEELDITYLQTTANELGIVTKPKNVTFWGKKIKNVLLEDSTCEKKSGCTHCGSEKVRSKGTKGYQKRYLDENGEWQSCEVFSKFCDNPDCKHKVFTDLPEHLLPHSPYSLGIRLQAFYLVAVVGGSYRRVAAALGVKSSRVYEWVSAFGQELLPIAALFGVVRSSGIIGVDEKYVLVPLKAKRGEGPTKNKNKKRRWMYVYLAVDVYTYDLLHIEIYEYNTQNSTQAFLLALKSKGYRPRVIVTDLRKEYGPALDAVLAGARHHECIFHALQWWGRQMKDVYGSNYNKTHPEVVQLKEQIVKIFQTTSKRVAQKRYETVMAERSSYVSQNPKAASIFDSLERHWQKLVNAIESTIIPKTNNAVELVIRRFDQHYTNFCGFDTIESARTYLGVFEKAYRFTPFTDDASLEIRGKCPLELAGYDISLLPMTQICRGWALGWPPKQAQEAP